MTTLERLIAATVLAASAIAAPAFAQSYSHLEPITQGQKTRAEVLADLQIYRDSGLALVDSTEDIQVDSVRRQQAQARYEQLRQSPTYVALVKQFSDREASRKHVASR